MKEVTGELNLTIIVIVAVGLILVFVSSFLPEVFDSIKNRWNESTGSTIYVEHNFE